MHRFGTRARHRRPRRKFLGAAVAVACLLGAGVASVSTIGGAGASTSPATTLPLGSTAPAALAPKTLAPGAARDMKLPAGTTQECPPARSLYQMQCQVFVGHNKVANVRNRVPSKASPAASIAGPLAPADLQAAYGLTAASTADGGGQTVAVIDAFGDPTIASDLQTYRQNYKLPACANASGVGTTAGCLTVLNQDGASPPPTTTDVGWEDETALDVEMVSAICPKCHIDLFEANSDQISDLGTAVNSAAKVTKFVSGSWGSEDFPGESTLDSAYFNHPGVVTAFASGDYGYGPLYPASSGLVTSVGGTFLEGDSSARGYSEVVWAGASDQDGLGTGTGCSAGEGKPSWQSDAGCSNRTENDISAVADAPAGIDIVSSSGDCLNVGSAGNECTVYGTSAATPIITSVYALAGSPEGNTYPSSYFYQAANHIYQATNGTAANLNDITSGQVDFCEGTRAYLCRAGTGYDGPTGWGTPKGIGAFSSTVTGDIVSVTNPGTVDLQAGVRYTLPAIKAVTTATTAPANKLTYFATGLTGTGLGINTANGAISGTLPATPVNVGVKVTVTDGTGASATVGFRIVSVPSLISSYHAGVGPIRLAPDGANVRCVNDTRNATGNGTPVDVYGCENVASETGWSDGPSGAPGLPGTIVIHGKCMYASGNPIVSGAKVGLFACNSAASEKWYLTGVNGEIVQASTGLCLNDPDSSLANNTQLTVATCNGEPSQSFLMPASPITSGLAGKCLAVSSGHAVSANCAATSSQEVTLLFDGKLEIGGKCLYKTGSSFNNGTAVSAITCLNDPTQPGYDTELWRITAYGQIENLLTEKCLAVPANNSRSGAFLAIEDCAGQPGEVWAAS